VDPPKYMNVESKIRYESPDKTAYRVVNTDRRSPEKESR